MSVRPAHTLAARALLAIALLGSTPAAGPTPSTPPTLMLPANAPPRILAISFPKVAFRPGETISGTVETSSNVASVEARIGSFFGISVPKMGVGRFELRYRVPHVPRFLRGNMTMQLIARNTRGDRTERDIRILIR